MNRNVIIVGGGIAGLATSIYLARGGCTVTLFEKRRNLGGRAITHLRSGFRFNLGPHMVYRKGAGRTVYRELGIPIRGGRSKASASALLGKEPYRFPITPLSVAFTSLLSLSGKFQAASLLMRIRRMDFSTVREMSIREWLDANVRDERLRLVMETLVRLATYSADLEQSASTALQQVNLVLRGVVYIDEGWQKIVDSLHSNAVTAGVNFVTSSRVVRVETEDGAVHAIDLGGLEAEDRDTTNEILRPDPTPTDSHGAHLPATTVVLAVDPTTARELVGAEPFSAGWGDLEPVTAACLDVALSRLPDPKRPFAIGLDRPLYLGAHSVHAQLTPRGGALIHVVKYLGDSAPSANDNYDAGTLRLSEQSRADEKELEAFLDEVQPGWRDLVVHRRFLPALAVSNALVKAGSPRPSPVTPVKGLYLVGDWVDTDGTMADGALSSARAVAKAILAT